ncbi:hypothetical protein ABLO07_14290 [Mycobacterium tuberculosis]
MAIGSGQIKTGAPARSERVNQLAADRRGAAARYARSDLAFPRFACETK